MAPGPHYPDLLATTAMWMAMMAVMMLPVVLPWLLGFAALSRDRETGTIRSGWVALFALGYGTVWGGFSLLAATLQLGFQGWGLLGASTGSATTSGGTVATAGGLATAAGGLILIAAGLYQVAPAKAACLEHCRTPLSYFLTSWRNGPRGAFRMGLSHGAFCVGCCWALMLTGFALGLMNLKWMAALTALIGIETLAPYGKRIGQLAGAAMVLWGLTLLTGF